MAVKRLVIVGASLAGLRAAQSARREGFTGEVVIVGAEPHLPYNRPPLSKDLLTGGQDPSGLAFPLGELEVEWRLGTAAAALDPAARRLQLSDGSTLGYDRLIAATGCRARRWHGTGSELSGVHTLRNLEDALALRSELLPGRRLAIVGAGFIGCEVAAGARALGLDVTLVDIAPYPMLPLGPELGQRWLRMHREHGVELRLGTGIEAIHPSVGVGAAAAGGVAAGGAAAAGAGSSPPVAGTAPERVGAVELTDGSRVAADVVLIALGSQLNLDWMQDSRIELNPAVVTGATLTSSDPDILAAGDIAACPVPIADHEPLRIEHWTTAAEHGQLAGRNALLDPGERVPHSAVPYFWSDQYDVKIQSVGCSALGERTELLECSPDGERLVAARIRGDRVVAVVALNAARRLAWYRRRLVEPPKLEVLRELIRAEESALPAPAPGASL